MSIHEKPTAIVRGIGFRRTRVEPHRNSVNLRGSADSILRDAAQVREAHDVKGDAPWR